MSGTRNGAGQADAATSARSHVFSVVASSRSAATRGKPVRRSTSSGPKGRDPGQKAHETLNRIDIHSGRTRSRVGIDESKSNPNRIGIDPRNRMGIESGRIGLLQHQRPTPERMESPGICFSAPLGPLSDGKDGVLGGGEEGGGGREAWVLTDRMGSNSSPRTPRNPSAGSAAPRARKTRSPGRPRGP